MDIVSQKVGKIDRLRAKGYSTTLAEYSLNEDEHHKTLEATYAMLDRFNGAMTKALKRRHVNFKTLYKEAQPCLNRPPFARSEGDRWVPCAIFEQMQELLECRKANDLHNVETAMLGRQLVAKREELKAYGVQNEGRDGIVKERQQISKNYDQAKLDKAIRDQNVSERERKLVNTIWE